MDKTLSIKSVMQSISEEVIETKWTLPAEAYVNIYFYVVLISLINLFTIHYWKNSKYGHQSEIFKAMHKTWLRFSILILLLLNSVTIQPHLFCIFLLFVFMTVFAIQNSLNLFFRLSPLFNIDNIFLLSCKCLQQSSLQI